MQTRRSTPWAAVAMFAVSSLSMLGCWSLALVMLSSGILTQYESTPIPVQPASIFMRAAGLFLVGLLLAPSALLSLYRIMDKPIPDWRWGGSIARLPWILLVIWPLVLLLGHWAATQSRLDWALLPGLYVLGVALPVWWLVEIGRQGLPAQGPYRSWGIFSLGMVLGPALAIALELLVVGLLAGFVILLIALNPEWSAEINRVAVRLMNSAANPEAIGRILRPYLLQPGILYLVLALVSGVVPLIEELVKPIGVWLLGRRVLTPAEGFVLGLLSGTGFALFESLSMASNLTGAAWTGVVAARAGTDLLHISTSGLMGWALVSAWREGRYIRLGLTYLVAVSLHGLWNMLSILTILGEMVAFAPPDLLVIFQRANLAPLGMGVLLVVMFLLLFGANRRLKAMGDQAVGQFRVMPSNQP